LRTIYFIDFFSKNKNTYVKTISKNLYRLNAKRLKPHNMPTRIKKKIFKIKLKLKLSMAKGKK